ncbi:MAG: polyribonucleotide nucleotidyltransferase [Candidatus Tectomicrobia bacterium]|nr:polyribonucleotide nucleotidyltransferase [Candidatus Tectomicrobia bacterium]
MSSQTASCLINGRTLTIETGEIAKQANGSALVRYGDTLVLAAATAATEERGDLDFFPLTIDYRERTYAAGKIPGGFFKREGRPSEKETLTSRIIDRPLRPLFPAGYKKETQVICTVLSVDNENDPDVVALTAASAALSVSDVPFLGPVGAVRVGYTDNQIIINPTTEELERGQLNMVVAGTREAIVMVEGGAQELPEDIVLSALESAHQALQACIDIQLQLQQQTGKDKLPIAAPAADDTLRQSVEDMAGERLRAALTVSGKQERQDALAALQQEVVAAFEGSEDSDAGASAKTIKGFLHDMESAEMRRQILQESRRADGRGLADIRPISGRVSLLPRTHGSALFTRGETQALVVATLGTQGDEQIIDDLGGKTSKRFMLHYNFPSYSVGEVRPLRGPGRREIGHGALAERAIRPVLPAHDSFPYTLRVVSDIMESNGSSSMATVCGGALSLMDAGVPIKAPVAGIAMGLIAEGEEVAILSDILGVEDHLGDMDFKVAGTEQGITAIQMDIKIAGVSSDIMARALEQARQGRLHILQEMQRILGGPRVETSTYAPRIVTLKINKDKVREVIGPGGKTIRGIIEATGVTIDIEDDGTVLIASANETASQEAVQIVRDLTKEAEIGQIYMGTVRKIMDFGAFVEIFPGTDGLLHISQISEKRVNKVTDEVQEGDRIIVKVLEVDRNGRIKLSHKEAIRDQEAAEIS